MMKKLTIGILCLKDRNLGDMVIFENTKYLVEKTLTEKKIEYEIKTIDIGKTKIDEIKISNKRKKYNDFLEKKLHFYENTIGRFKDISKYRILNEWKRTPYYVFIKHRVLRKLENVDVIIFPGGGLIKYHLQDFHLIIHEVTKFADKMNKTVLFNAVGIEGYDENDARCMILKKAINRKCVKAISTRDDLKLLNEKYMTRNIPTCLVCDNALYSKELYNVKKKNSNTIGLGVIRPEIFGEYLCKVDEEVLLKMFSETITKLKEKGFEVKLFSNGVIRDQKFILKIKEYMNADDSFDEMIEPRCTKSDELVNLISKYKIVVGSRLHTSIIAYSLGIPVVGIVWNKKQTLFSELNHIEDYFLSPKDLNSDKLVEKILDTPNQKKLNKEYKETGYKFLNEQLTEIIDKL